MRPPVLVHVAWTLIAIVAFVVGTFVSDPPDAHSTAELSQGLALQTEELAQAVASEGFIPLGLQNGVSVALNTDQARARTFEILSESNRTKRMRQISELLEGVTRENWREVIEAFRRQTIHEGRMHDPEWYLALDRIGEIAGSEAVEDALNSDHADMARRLLNGWASSAPDQAMAWFQSQAPELQGQLFQPLVNGIARANPKQALELAVSQSPQFQDATFPTVVDAALQYGGFPAAEELLRTLLGRSDVAEGIRAKFFYNIARRKLNSAGVGGNSLAVLDWLDGYLGDRSPAGSGAVQELIGSSAAVNVEATMQWLEARADRFGPEKGAVAYGAVARAWQLKAPDQFTAWIDAHPEHPQHAAMAAVAVNSLLQARKLEEAKRLGATIRDQALRTKIENAFQQYGS